MLEKLIKERKSVREYLSKEIPNEDLKKILLAGNLAPSWMNSQSWKFILVKDEQLKELLSKLAMNQKHIKTANAVIAIIADKSVWRKENFSKVLKNLNIPEESFEKIFNLPLLYPNSEEKILIRSVEQAAIAMSFMLLQAKELGIDSCVIGAISNETTKIDPDLNTKINEKLNLNKDDVLISMLTLGYNKNQNAQIENKAQSRKNFDDVVFFEKVGQKLNF